MLSHMLEWYDLRDDERKVLDLALSVAREEIAPYAEQHDRDGTFVRESIEALGKSGLLGVFVPKEYGGLGGSPPAATLAIEAVVDGLRVDRHVVHVPLQLDSRR